MTIFSLYKMIIFTSHLAKKILLSAGAKKHLSSLERSSSFKSTFKSLWHVLRQTSFQLIVLEYCSFYSVEITISIMIFNKSTFTKLMFGFFFRNLVHLGQQRVATKMEIFQSFAFLIGNTFQLQIYDVFCLVQVLESSCFYIVRVIYWRYLK